MSSSTNGLNGISFIPFAIDVAPAGSIVDFEQLPDWVPARRRLRVVEGARGLYIVPADAGDGLHDSERRCVRGG